MGWLPRVGFATLRNATVVSVGGGKATVTIDGGDAAGLPIYGGSPKAGDKVLVAVQGDQMLVLGAGGQPTGGHCRGTLSGSAPVSTATKLALTKQAGSVDVTVSGTAATISKAGYWAISARVWSSTAPAQGQRSFTSIVLNGSPDTPLARISYGVGDGVAGISTVVYLDAGSSISFDYYTQNGASTISTSTSTFTFKYLGAA